MRRVHVSKTNKGNKIENFINFCSSYAEKRLVDEGSSLHHIFSKFVRICAPRFLVKRLPTYSVPNNGLLLSFFATSFTPNFSKANPFVLYYYFFLFAPAVASFTSPSVRTNINSFCSLRLKRALSPSRSLCSLSCKC